jgi:hypothetical protein
MIPSERFHSERFPFSQKVDSERFLLKDFILKDSGFSEFFFWKIPSERFHAERFWLCQKVNSERFHSERFRFWWKYFLKDSLWKIPFWIRTAQDDIASKRQYAQPAHVEEEDGATTTVYWRGAERGDQVVLSGRDSTMHFVT